MASAGEIRSQVARETERRTRLAVPSLAGGVLYLLGTIIIASTLSGAPTVGILQGLKPALTGEANPAESPRAPEVKYISHHAFALISGSILAAVAIGVLTLVLLLLLDAARFRRPQMWAGARPLVIFGGAGLAIVSVAHQVVEAVRTHSFSVGHDLSNHAVDQALVKGAANLATEYADLIAGLALAGGMIIVVTNAQRVGLLPRWVGILGMIAAVLLFLPFGGAQLEVIPALWMVAVGILFAGRWPKPGTPPAWEAGEARPWPTAAERRAERTGGAGARTPQPATAPAGAAGASATAPAAPPARSGKRRRKRGR